MMLAALVASATLVGLAAPQTPPATTAGMTPQQLARLLATDPNAPPVIDMALRLIRAGAGGSSIARSAARGDEPAFVYAGLGPCIVGAAATDWALANSSTWRASGRVRSVEGGIATADVEWQRIDYRPNGVTAGPRVRTTLTLPLGERLAVDFVDTSGSACRTDALIFEIGVAPDHGTRLSMSSEGRTQPAASGISRGGGGGGAGRPSVDDEGVDAERQRQGAEAARAAPIVTRAMPPREYSVDLWLLPDAPGPSRPPGLAQRLSKSIGGTGGRFEFPPETWTVRGDLAVDIDVSALVIPVDGERIIVAITRRMTPSDGTAPASDGWVKSVPMPTSADILSFEIPAPSGAPQAGNGTALRQGYSLRLRIARR